MSKIIKVDIMSGEVDELIKKLENLKKSAEKVKDDMIDDFKKVGRDSITSALSSDPYLNDNSSNTSYYETENEIGVSGSQSVYDEFGTGTLGQNNPHPEKDSYGTPLNDYNTGKTIRPNAGINSSGFGITEASKRGIPLNGMYWTYMKDGQKIYTQGRPAGAYVYKGKKAIVNSMKEINKKRVGELLSKL